MTGMDRVITVLTVLCWYFISTAIAARMAAPKQREACEEFYYYDHGTEHCEHCRDICVAATVKGTMDQCWELCQSYALVLWPQRKATPTPADPPSKENDDNPSFPLAGQVALPLVSVAIIAGVLLAVAFIRRRQNALKNQRVRERPQSPVTNLNPAQTSLLEPAEENGVSVNMSARATFGTEASGSTAGTQEQRGGGPEEASLAEGRGSTLAQATPTRCHMPVCVSPEGNDASFALALPGTAYPLASTGIAYPQASYQRPPSLPDADLDSTELKTLLPSMSSDSLYMGADGGLTSPSTSSTRV